MDRRLFEDFDEQTVSRGLAYAHQGAVTDIQEGERGVAAQVRGTRRSPYGVYIPFNPKTDLIDPSSASCTCPMAVMCKHIVAVTLVYLGEAAGNQFDPGKPPRADRGRPPSRESLLDELGRVMGPSTLPADKVLAIDEADTPRGYSRLDEILRPRPARRKSPSERWRLAFTVSKHPRTEWRHRQGYATPGAEPHVCIAPALQYVRKDGLLGRLDKYRADVDRDPADPASEALLEMLSLDGGEAPLLLHWDYILSHPALPLYSTGADGRGRNDLLLQPVRITRIRVGFQPETEDTYTPGDVRVVPVVRVDLDGDGSAFAAAEIQVVDWVDAWKGKLVAVAGLQLGWCVGDERMLALVRHLFADSPLLDRGQLAELKARVEAERSTLVSVDFPYRAMRLATRRPQADVLLQEMADGISAELTFRYPAKSEIPEAGSDEWVLLRRHQAFEDGISRVLRDLFLHGHRRVRLDYRPWETPGQWSFRTGMAEFLEAFGADLLSRGIGLCIGDTSHRLARTGAVLQVRVSSGIDWFDLVVSAGEDLDLSGVDLNDPLFSHGFVRNGNRIIYIGSEEAEKLREVISLLDPSQRSPRVSRRDLEGAALLQRLVQQAPTELARAAEISRALAAPAAFAEAALPKGFQGTLRDYQRIGFGWLSFLAEHGLNGCLADDMGLGKTVQALALLQSLGENKMPRSTVAAQMPRSTVAADRAHGPSLVVAPVSTLQNWKAEAERFTPGLCVLVHHGSERPRDAQAFEDLDLVIVSYATLRIDQELFQQREWRVLILDEAQSIKNPGSQSFAAVKTLKSRHRFTLTGTPLENSVIDLWAQFDFLEPGLLGSMQRFKKRFGSRGADSPDPERQRLRRIVRPFILRRTKDVVEKSLPPKEEVRLFAEMGTRQRAAYDALKDGYRKRISAALKEKGIAGSGALIFEGLLRLRQAACIPEHANPSLKGIPAAKFELLEEVLEEIVAEGHRVLVFSQFVQTLKVVAGMLDHRQVPHAYLDGSTRNRQQVIDRFQADPRIPLFLLSLKAGGLGINLTAADYVVIFDPWWNPAVERQAVDRSHRIGQQKPVFVYRLITKESIEERILALQDQKSALAAELIEENPRSLLSLGEQELIGFFS